MTESITPGTGTTQETPTPAPLTLLQLCEKDLDVTSDFDDLIQVHIDAAKADLGIAGVTKSTVESDPLVKVSIMAYVKWNWNAGQPEAEALQRIYETFKKQLMSATGYTDWLDGSAEEDSEDDPEESGDS